MRPTTARKVTAPPPPAPEEILTASGVVRGFLERFFADPRARVLALAITLGRLASVYGIELDGLFHAARTSYLASEETER